MKLKINKNKITFKLSQHEKKLLSSPNQYLTETIEFFNQPSLSYTIGLINDEEASLSYSNHEIKLLCPYKTFELLTSPSKQGIEFDFTSLKIVVQVDILSEKQHAN